MASEASSAAVIRTKRLIWFSPRRVIAIRHKFPTDRFVPRKPKLNNFLRFRASITGYSRVWPPLTTPPAARSGIRPARGARPGRRCHVASSPVAFAPVCARRLWQLAGLAALQGQPPRKHRAASWLAAARPVTNRRPSRSPARWLAGWCRSRSSRPAPRPCPTPPARRGERRRDIHESDKPIMPANRNRARPLACRSRQASHRDSSFECERRQGTGETRRSYRMFDANADAVAPNISE